MEKIKLIFIVCFLAAHSIAGCHLYGNDMTSTGVELPNFVASRYFSEQVLAYTYNPDIKIEINAPPIAEFDETLPTALVFYALPNAHSIDWTIGKEITGGEDARYTGQHIGAQTRFIRAQKPGYNLVAVYLEVPQQAWGTWRSANASGNVIIKECVESILSLFEDYNPYVVLSGYEGGGNHTFGFMEAVTDIPSYVKRISFLDSHLNWDNDKYGPKLTRWLQASPDNYLSVICYNEGEPASNTWNKSQEMYDYLKANLPNSWIESEDANFIKYSTNGIQFLLKPNASSASFEKNAYIQANLAGTGKEETGYTFGGNSTYNSYIQGVKVYPHILKIPPRKKNAGGGSAFMDQIASMSLTNRETAIYNEISSGNIPNAFRKVNHITETVKDANNVDHIVEIDVMPDFLAIGSDDDFCRIPMLPTTAQKLATLFGATLPTSKISDLAWKYAEVKMSPQPMTPDATMTTVPVFKEHNRLLEVQRATFGKLLSAPIAGHKKDIIVSNRIAGESTKLFIYGWHYQTGSPIQSISGAHTLDYVDYSHGVRIVNQELLVDGVLTKVRDVLRDNVKYKLLSSESGIMTVTEYGGTPLSVPSAVKSFAVVPVNAASVRVLLTPEANVNYTILYGTDVNSLNQSMVYNSANPVVGGLTADRLYYFGIKATNSDGDSPVSKKLAATPTEKSKYALLVEGFNRIVTGNTGTFAAQHAEALAALDKPVASASNDAVIAGLINLNDYPFVDWILGEESTVDRTFDLTEQTKVKSYLESGGFLYASGAEIGWDIGRSESANVSIPFMTDYLKATFVADNPGTANGQSHKAVILPDAGFGNDNFTFSFADGTTTAVAYPDVLTPTGGSVGFMRYILDAGGNTNINYAGIAYTGTFGTSSAKGKVIVSGIPFESIVPGDARKELMSRIVDYKGAGTGIRNTTAASDNVYTTSSGIRVELEVPSDVIIFDITGKLIYKTYVAETIEYPLPAGVYVVKVNDRATKVVK